ncbi:hypothetical protein KW830_02020 [Comamonas sp. CMM03]|uniref:hypothetical protein n=1 Tax=Comamonas sp. CMM03 TaxID=2854781 RepID=UPI001C449E5F|nr:hypothetical protein [Comamonas sp. CMM03]MBV7417227.1 hypothetical protein [Comamonas sp. CMM03]
MLLAPGYGTVIPRTVRTLAQQMAAVVALAPVQTPLPMARVRAGTRVNASPDAVTSTVGHGATRLAPASTWRLGTAMLSATEGTRP